MKVSILSIGNELLNGTTINTNLSLIGKELAAAGCVPEMEITVPDSIPEIKIALDMLLDESDVVISMGGLGPTSDDLTRDAVADYLELDLLEDNEIKEKLIAFWKARRPGPMPESILKQALVPKDAEVLENKQGTAPGIHIYTEDGEKDIFLIPGPPNEASQIFFDYVLPHIKSQITEPVFTEYVFTVGIPESAVEEAVAPLILKSPELSVAYCASVESVRIFIKGTNSVDVSSKISEIREALKEDILRPGCTSVQEEVSMLLKEKNLKLAIAESCTGGKIAAALTELPGASEFLRGSLVVYCNEWKEKLLEIKKETLEKHGAVSRECASEMLENLCGKFGVETGIAVTGIAGPSGATSEKHVGLVYIATSVNGKSLINEYSFSGTRDVIRRRATITALNQLRKQMLG